MAKIRLYGVLAEKFGKVLEVHARDFREVMNSLRTQLPEFSQIVADNSFRVRIAKHDTCEDKLTLDSQRPLKDGDVVHLVPVVAGSGKFFQVIVGVVLIVVGVYMNIAAPGSGNAFLAAGIATALGGVVQLLTKQPKMPDGADAGASKNNTFSNLSNRTAQGSVATVVYGIMLVGSKKLSEGVYTIETKSGGAKPEQKPNTGSMPLEFLLEYRKPKNYVSGAGASAVTYPVDTNNSSVKDVNYFLTARSK